MANKKEALYDPKRNPLFRADYRPSEYKIPETKMHISLDEENTVVRNRFKVIRNPDLPNAGGPLLLDGEKMRLMSLEIIVDGKKRALDRSEYIVGEKNLIIKNPPEKPFELEIVNEINPKENTALSGLYLSGDLLCTQCESRGFRNITYFLDRPDNLATYEVTLEADKKKFPVILANGNGDPFNTKDLGNGRHEATWKDPWPKPSYLFATVGGNMKVLEDKFTTMSGKEVDIRIFVQPEYEDKIAWAMQSVKRSMKWDEEVYGREYDLDCFHVVATDKFNFGAMENKGLNVFNVSALVGTPELATDAELTRIESIIAHEYFHNWTGDRVTLRDWFELTLKEGLTVLRDRQFTADMHSKDIKLIEDATALRTAQFTEDAGSGAHPIRPDKVEVFENIYTGTIYEKGSHVLGMMHTMMGPATWRLATDEYFNRFDGKAVSCDDFIDVMEEVSGIDLKQFRTWYSQSGTPEITYAGDYDAKTKTYKLTLTQNTPPTADQKTKKNLHIPVAIGLIGKDGKDILEEGTRILHLKEKSQTFTFENVEGPVVPSILRGFSAPVKVMTQPSDEDLVFLMTHDSDGYNKFAAADTLKVKALHGLIKDAQAGKELKLSPSFVDAYRTNIKNALSGDLEFNALTLGLPAYDIITQGLDVIDPDAVDTAIKFMKKELATTFIQDMENVYAVTATPADERYDVVPEQVGRRSLHNMALGYIASLETTETKAQIVTQYESAANMTEKLAAVSVASRLDDKKLAGTMLYDFHDSYKEHVNVVTKWLRLSAAVPGEGAVERVRELMQHPVYDKTNPNKVRATAFGFIVGNPVGFHNKDGSGYKFLADLVIEMNPINQNVAAMLSEEFAQFKRYDAKRQGLMVAEMNRIMATPDLAAGIKEIVGKALDTVVETPAVAKASAKFKKSARKKAG